MVRHGWAVVCLAMAAGMAFAVEARAEEPSPSESQAAETVILTVAGTQFLYVPGLSRVAIGDPQVADIETQGNGKLKLIGVGEGHTTLMTWTKDGVRTEYLVTVKR